MSHKEIKSDDSIGMGEYHREKAYDAQRSIFKALSDGQPHRNMELKEKTKLSPRTLDKHLDKLVELGVVNKQKDTQSGAYPYPVFYKATNDLLKYIKSSLLRDDFSETIDGMIQETKDPLMILEVIHEYSQLAFIKILKEIQAKKAMDFERRQFLEEIFLWSNYRHFTMELIEASLKIADTLKMDELLIKQTERLRNQYQKIIDEYTEA